MLPILGEPPWRAEGGSELDPGVISFEVTADRGASGAGGSWGKGMMDGFKSTVA